MTTLILTLSGRDRPGLVESIAATVTAHDGLWEESRLAHLNGWFAGIVRVSLPAERARSLEASLSLRDVESLEVRVREATEASTPEGEWVELDVIGGDRPGIVQRVTQALVKAEVNVESLETACEDGPWSGGRVFRARGRLHVPGSTNIDLLRRSLEAIGQDLLVDITLSTPAHASAR